MLCVSRQYIVVVSFLAELSASKSFVLPRSQVNCFD